MSGRRYPLEPLRSAVGASSINAMLRRLGVSGSTEQDYRRNGVSEKVADRLAARSGLVAYEVWPEMVDRAIADVQLTCQHTKCGATFVPEHAGQLYCQPVCGGRERARRHAARRYRSDAIYAERKRAERREYSDYVRGRREGREVAP